MKARDRNLNTLVRPFRRKLVADLSHAEYRGHNTVKSIPVRHPDENFEVPVYHEQLVFSRYRAIPPDPGATTDEDELGGRGR